MYSSEFDVVDSGSLASVNRSSANAFQSRRVSEGLFATSEEATTFWEEGVTQSPSVSPSTGAESECPFLGTHRALVHPQLRTHRGVPHPGFTEVSSLSLYTASS